MVFLCYPSNKLEIKKITYKNSINEVSNTIFIFGIPLKVSSINDAKKYLMAEIGNIEG
jgi:hypothetical protein